MTRTSRTGTRCRRRPGGWPPDDGGVRRIPDPHRPSDRPAAGLLEGDRRVRQHADHGGLRQRGQRRRAARPGPPTSCSSSTTRRRALEESLRARSTSSAAPTTFDHYPWGWTWAGNTPFRRWKRETYRGGTTDPFLVHWPAGHPGAGRDPYPVRAHHRHGARPCWTRSAVQPPATIRGVTQSPIHGVSFAHTFDDPAAPTRHRTQYFEMFGHRAHRPRRVAGGLPLAGAVVRRGRQAIRRADHR